MEDLKERVGNKALAKLMFLDNELKTWNDKLDNPPFGLSVEQVQLVIDSKLREIEVWKFILNSAS